MAVAPDLQTRFREIAWAAAREFSTRYPDLQILQSESGVPEPGLSAQAVGPEWAWRRLEDAGARQPLYRIEMTIVTDHPSGLRLEHVIISGYRIHTKALNTGFILPENLKHHDENKSAVAKVVRELEAICQFSEDQLAKPSP